MPVTQGLRRDPVLVAQPDGVSSARTFVRGRCNLVLELANFFSPFLSGKIPITKDNLFNYVKEAIKSKKSVPELFASHNKLFSYPKIVETAKNEILKIYTSLNEVINESQRQVNPLTDAVGKFQLFAKNNTGIPNLAISDKHFDAVRNTRDLISKYKKEVSSYYGGFKTRKNRHRQIQKRSLKKNGASHRS